MIVAVLRFLAVQFLYGLCILASYELFPLLYPFGKWILKYKIPLLYIFFDKEDGIWGSPSWRAQRGHNIYSGQKVYIRIPKIKIWKLTIPKITISFYLCRLLNRFRIALFWSWRNPAWNFKYVFKPKSGEAKIVRFSGLTMKHGMEWSVWDMANIKTESVTGEYASNFGPIFSFRYSIIGKMFLVYKIDGTTYFRYSKVWFGKKSRKWYEIQLGTNHYRYTVKFRTMKSI